MRHLSIVLCLILGVASAQAPDEKPQDLAYILPADTLVMLEAEDLGGMEAWMRDTALGRIWAEPEVQRFAKGLEKTLMESMERMQGGFNPLGMVGLDAKDFMGIEIRRAGFALVGFEFGGFMPQFDLVLTAQFRTGAEKGDKIVNALRQGVQRFTGLPFEEVTLQGKKIWRANPMGYEVCLFMEGDRFLLTTKTERMDQILAALRDGLPESLAANPRFGKIVQSMGAHRRALFAYADVKRLHEKGVAIARTMIEQQALPEKNLVQFEGYWKGLGLDAVEAVAFADIPQGTGFRTEAAVTFTERRGLLSVIPAGRVNHRFAKHAPEGALLYGAENVDLGAYLKGWVDLIASFEPRTHGQVQKFLGEFRTHLGVDLKTDILDALGSDWAAYVGAPPEGGLIPDLALFVTVKDRAKLEKSLDTVVQRLAGMAAEERVYARLGETDFRGLKIRYLEMAERKDPIPIVPSWAFVDDYMVVALVPQTIKHAMTEKPSLARSEDFRSLLRSVPQESMNASWIDTRRLVGWIYNTGVPIAQALQGAANRELAKFGMTLNLEDLPPAEVITRHLGGMMTYTSVEDDCIRFGYVSPFGAPALLGVMATGGAMAGLTLTRGVVRHATKRPAEDARLKAELRKAEVEKAQLKNQLAMERAKYEERISVIEAQLAELRKLIEESGGR